MFILILNTIFVFARPADDAVTGATPNDRTQQDQQIDDECAPRMAQGVDHYAACVAEKGRAAEQERQRRLEAQRMMEINEGPGDEPAPMMCNPDGAVAACRRASESAAFVNNPANSDQQIMRAMQACRAACNPDSSQVLRNYLNGCRGDVSSKKRVMLQAMNNCGTGTTTSGNSGHVPGDQHPPSTTAPDESTWSGWASAKFNSLSTQAGDWWSQQMVKMQEQGAASAANPSGATDDPFATNSTVRVGAPGNAEFSQLSFGEAVSGAPAPTTFPVSEEGLAMGTPQPPSGGQPAPVARPVAGGGGSGGDSSGVSDTSTYGTGDSQQVVTPVNEPVNYQPGNFAGLQSAMSAPAGAGGMASSSSSSFGGEVSRGGGSAGGASSGGSPNGNSRPLAFEGSGQVSPSALRGNDSPAAGVPAASGASAASLDVAAPGGGSRGGGGFPDFGGGRMMAAARSGAGSLEAQMSAPMRSDSFYRPSGSRGVVAARGGRAAASCKGPNCSRPKRSRAGIAAANCDGNPQCLLALTGKLRGPQRTTSDEIYQADGGSLQASSGLSGDRGIASVPKRAEPGGVVRGKLQDVLNHLGSSEHFKLDHNGMLDVDL